MFLFFLMAPGKMKLRSLRRSTLNFLKSRIDLDGDFSAFNTPNGDQLNLYLNAFSNFGIPPQ